MSTYSTNDFKIGLKIILDGDPFTIIENEFVKPGKGQAFNRVKVRNLKNNKVIDRTFRSGDTVESANIIDKELQYLYNDNTYWYFMDNQNYEQVVANISAIGDSTKWIKEEMICLVTLWNNVPISVMPPNFVTMTVIKTEPGLRGDTTSGGNKPATLETGAIVRVPLFIQVGEVIKVDTRNGQYISRIKE